MLRVLGKISSGPDAKARSNTVFSCKLISKLTVGRSNFKLGMCICIIMERILGIILCNLKVKG